ncbi:MAG: SIS domain-containing protein [Candidatus Velamenicoccus archaeovorus]
MRSLRSFPDPFLGEIASQPDALRRAAAALLDERTALERIHEAGSAARTLVFTGMGSSYDACYPAVNDLAGRGVPAILVDTAELLHFRRPVLGPQTLVVVVSQSGESAEIVKLASDISKQRLRPIVLSITNGLDNDLAKRADIRLDTWAGHESGPSTMTFAAAMATLSGVARLLAGDSVDTAIDRTRTGAEAAARSVERLLSDAEAWADELVEILGDRGVTVVLGRGPARAAAEMGALMLKECGIMAESLESAAFRHGPLELAGPDMAAIVLATEPETRRLDLALARDLVDAGSSVLVITPDGEAPKGAHAVATGYQDRALMSAVSIVPVQLLSWKLASLRGRTPGAYLRASKVTTRE